MRMGLCSPASGLRISSRWSLLSAQRASGPSAYGLRLGQSLKMREAGPAGLSHCLGGVPAGFYSEVQRFEA